MEGFSGKGTFGRSTRISFELCELLGDYLILSSVVDVPEHSSTTPCTHLLFAIEIEMENQNILTQHI